MAARIIDAGRPSDAQTVELNQGTRDKRVLDETACGTVEILGDTVTSRENVLRCGGNAGWKGRFEENGEGFKVILTK